MAGEIRGVVYTKPWVADLILDLAGYRAAEDLAARYVVESSAGEGMFLIPMIRRLLASLAVHGRRLDDARQAIRAYELDAGAVTGDTQMGAPETLLTDVLRDAGLCRSEPYRQHPVRCRSR